MRKTMLSIIAIMLLTLSSSDLFAQVVPPPPNPPLGIPVDTNAVVLLVMGLALFVYKTYRKNELVTAE